MTTRHGGYVVVFEDDIREDDAQQIISALRLIKGVIDVVPFQSGTTVGEIVTGTRLRTKYEERLVEVIKEMRSDG